MQLDKLMTLFLDIFFPSEIRTVLAEVYSSNPISKRLLGGGSTVHVVIAIGRDHTDPGKPRIAANHTGVRCLVAKPKVSCV